MRKTIGVWLLVFFATISFVVESNAQCWLTQLSADLKSTNASADFKNFVKNEATSFEAYKTFVNAQGLSSPLKNNVTVLSTVAELRKDATFIKSLGGESGFAAYIGTFADLYKSLPVDAQINLVALAKANRRTDILSTIKTWPADMQSEFFENLMKTPNTVTVSNGFLANRLQDIDSEMLYYYKKLTDLEKAEFKKYDFDFLSGCKGRSDEELLAYLDLGTRELKALEIGALFPRVAALLKVTNYRYNLFNSITNLFISGGKPMNDFIEIYKKDEVTYNVLIVLKGKSQSEIKAGLEVAFKGADFDAHHILSFSSLYKSEACKRIMEWALMQNPPKTFLFHDIDNLIFLRGVNHTGGTLSHNRYDELIMEELSGLENLFKTDPGAAYNGMTDIVKEYKNKIIDELIGSSKRLDELN